MIRLEVVTMMQPDPATSLAVHLGVMLKCRCERDGRYMHMFAHV